MKLSLAQLEYLKSRLAVTCVTDGIVHRQLESIISGAIAVQREIESNYNAYVDIEHDNNHNPIRCY